MRGDISKKAVDEIQPGEKDVFLWDNKTKGFGVMVTPAGKRVYIFQYRWPGRKTPQKVTLGKHGDPWTTSQARKQAEVFRVEVHKGINPRDSLRAREQEEAKAITVRQLCELYLLDGCKTKKTSTIATDKGRINRHIIPLLGGIFSFAIEEGFRNDNPVKGVKRFCDKKNERY